MREHRLNSQCLSSGHVSDMARRTFCVLAMLLFLTSTQGVLAQDGSETMPEVRWRRSLETGTRDRDGNILGGTEIRALASFDGKLYAANGYWTDKNRDDLALPGAQVFVLDRSPQEGGTWRQDLQLTERVGERPKPRKADPNWRRYHTIAALESISFSQGTDKRRLSEPARLLVAGVWQHIAALEIFVRPSGDAEWEKSVIVSEKSLKAAERTHVRSFIVYTDKVTGEEQLFVGASPHYQTKLPTSIYSGTYDPSLPGKIRWNAQPEKWLARPASDDRVTSFSEANGELYATVCNKIYKRIDGKKPSWKKIFTQKTRGCPPGRGEWGLRGSTTIPRYNGDGQNILVAAEGEGTITRVDPLANFAASPEINVSKYLQSQWGYPVAYPIIAYNHMHPVTLPRGWTALLLGLEALYPPYPRPPDTWNQTGWERGAWYLIRYHRARYELRNITDRSLENEPPLVATRTFIESPFPSEQGRVIYAGGFDCNGKLGVNHNTAWLYRGEFLK